MLELCQFVYYLIIVKIFEIINFSKKINDCIEKVKGNNLS